MVKKKLGVLGGMGSEATSYFFEELVNHTRAANDQEHIDTFIYNKATMPDRTRAILSGDTKELEAQLIESVQLLERVGADHIAIPCNTSHYFYEIMQASINVPIIHMIEESVLSAIGAKEDVRKIGIMATSGTINTGVYHKEIVKHGREAVVPSPEKQEDVMSLIYDDIKQGKSGDYSKFQRVYDELVEAGCDIIILACTELSVFKKRHEIYDDCLDALDVLVKESIVRSNADYL